MTSTEKSSAELEGRTKKVCQVYEQTRELEKQGVKVFSTDEKTGIQALERAAAGKPLKCGKPHRVEYDYKRHGTLNLMTNFEVLSGRIKHSTIKPTRTEEDFVGHIRQSIEKETRAGGWLFVVDQLNIQQSASLVKLVAELEGMSQRELGEKGKSGCLKSMVSRRDFLESESHRLRFVYTPKHCSWLNQIEMWFSILVRKLLKWGNFLSQEDLQEQIERFIEYFNKTMANPFKWTFKGLPLRI